MSLHAGDEGPKRKREASVGVYETYDGKAAERDDCVVHLFNVIDTYISKLDVENGNQPETKRCRNKYIFAASTDDENEGLLAKYSRVKAGINVLGDITNTLCTTVPYKDFVNFIFNIYLCMQEMKALRENGKQVSVCTKH